MQAQSATMRKKINILLLFVLHISAVECAISRYPSDATYYPGGKLRLNCTSNTGVPVAWLQGLTNVFRSNTINSSYDQLFVVDRSEGYDLEALPLPTVSFCGKYSCVENNGAGPEEAYANVSVAENLACSANATEAVPAAVIQFTCIAQYCSVSIPIAYCQQNGSNDSVPVTTSYPSSNSVKAVITEQAIKLYNSDIKCYACYGSLGCFSTTLPQINETPVATTLVAPPSTSRNPSTSGTSQPTTTSPAHTDTQSETQTTHSLQLLVTATFAAPRSTSENSSAGETSIDTTHTATTAGVTTTQTHTQETQSSSIDITIGITNTTTEGSQILPMVLAPVLLAAVGVAAMIGFFKFKVRASSSAKTFAADTTIKPATYPAHSNKKLYAGYPQNKIFANAQTPYYFSKCLAIQRLNGLSYNSKRQNLGQGPFAARVYRPTVGVADPRLNRAHNAFYSYS